MIKTILFDMGGVIFRQDTREAIDRFAAIGLDTDEYIGDYGQKGFMLDCELGNINEKEFCRRLALAIGKDSVSHNEALYCWLGFISDVPVGHLRALDLLHKEYRLGLASNTNPFVMEFMDSSAISTDGRPVSSYFDALYCSYMLHLYKPSPDYFREILGRENIRPEEILFIDDSAANIEGAARLGINTLHVRSNENWIPILSQWLEAHHCIDPLKGKGLELL